MAKVGYIRTSTFSQNQEMQEDALKAAGVDKIFRDTASGSVDQRQGLKDALEWARPGDSLCIFKLDRLGRSIQHLIQIVQGLKEKGINLVSLHENINTDSPMGKLVFHIFAALSQCEREILVERTKHGLVAARARGRFGGRPLKMDSKKIELARKFLQDPASQVGDICKMLNVSRATLYRHLK